MAVFGETPQRIDNRRRLASLPAWKREALNRRMEDALRFAIHEIERGNYAQAERWMTHAADAERALFGEPVAS